MSKFTPQSRLTDMAKNILRKRYYDVGETKWHQLVKRVIEHICSEWSDENKKLMYDVFYNRYFIPNSPTMANSGKNRHAGLAACFVVPFEDTIEDIYKTKYDFALVARKGGGCGTTLSNIRPQGDIVNNSTHGYAGGGIDFADTISHDMQVITQGGLRAMAIMLTMRADHPDIMKFIRTKNEEGKISNANISVFASDEFMVAVENDETYWTHFNGKRYEELSAKDVFDEIIDGAWKNGEPKNIWACQ